MALNENSFSSISKTNLNFKNLMANLGIFILENKMEIFTIPCLNDNYSYILYDETNNAACVVDPSEANPIIDFIEKKFNLKYILNTHHHYDHVGGNEELKKKFNSK